MPASDPSGAALPATTPVDPLPGTMPWGVLVLAPDGTVAVLNPAAEALWGVPAATVLGHAPAQMQPNVLPPELLQALAAADEAQPPVTYWLPHTQQWIAMRTALAADGRLWVYWDNVTARQSATQTATQLPVDNLPAAADTPEQRLVQATLHQAGELYNTLFEGMSQGFCVIEVLFDDAQQPVDYRFLVTNPAFEQQTGLRNALGQTMRALQPGHETHWFELYGQVARTGEPQRFARVAERLGRFYEVYAFRVGGPAEHKVGILFSDISGRQRTEAALRESEESYRTLFNSIDEGYFLCDILFDEQGAPVDMLYVDANPAATRLVGADFRGKRLREMDPRYESYWFEIFGRVAQSGVAERQEKCAEPDKKWYDFYISKVGDEASRRVAVVFQDITERKQHEQALRESEAQIAADLAGMQRLYELQSKLSVQTNVKAAFRDVLALACEFTRTDRGCVQFLSDDGQRLEMFVWQGYADDGPFITFFRYEGLEAGCEVARVQRKRLIIEDTVGFEGLEGTEAGAASYADDIRAAQSTPMTSRANETIGVISTQFCQPHRPTDHELRLMDMLAWTAAEFLERHRADAALRESEQQFRLMADAVPQIVWLTDADGRVEFFNKQWSDYTGVPYEPTTAAQVAADFVHPNDGAATMAAFTEARATGSTFQVEHRIRSQAGDYRWFLVRAEPYREPSTGKIVRWFGASVDIHDRKQAEVALEKAHERLQLAMNSGRIFSFEMNPATRAQELSDNVDIVMGFPLPDHIDSTFELIHPDDLQPTVALINGAIESRGSYASEYRLVNPANGEVVWFHSQAAFIQSNASGEWRFVGIAQNITESKQAEEALRESEAKYRTLFNSIDEGYYLLEVIFDEHGEATDVLYLDANPAAVRMSGGERRGKTLREVGYYEEYWYELYGRVARTGVSERTEHFSSPAGIWVDSYTFKVGEEGNRVAAVFQDVTERKRREANQAFLVDLTTEFTRLATVDDIMQNVGAKIGAYMKVTSVVFSGVDEALGQVTVRHGWVETGAQSLVGNSYRLEEYVSPEFERLSRAGEPFVVRDTQTDPRTDAALYAALQVRSCMVVPFHHEGEWRQYLTAYSAKARDWHSDEVELFRELSNHIFPRLERARAEEVLRASEAQFQKAFSIATVGQLFFTLDGGMSKANPAFVRMSGYRNETLLTTNWETLTAPEFWDITIIHAGELADHGETAPYEKQFVRPDGARWWGLCAPIRLRGQGPAAECMEFVIDISERKQAEEQLRAFTASLEQQVDERTQALRENNELLQSVFDTSLISMSVLKAVRDEAGAILDFHIVIANQELEKETGRTDLVGKLYAQEYPGIKLTGLYDLMLSVLETGEPAGLEYYYGHEGFNKWYHCQFVKMDDGLVATNLDVTERKLAEEKIQEQAHFIARVNETLPDLMTVTELASGQVLYVNRDPNGAPGFEREKLLNVPQHEQTALLRMHPDDAALLPDYFVRAAALADHELATYSYRAKLNTDYWRSFQVRGSVFQRDPATGAATQILSVSQDVTAQKEAERQQAKSYQVLQQSEEVASLGSWDYDRNTGEFLWSEGMYRLFGLPPGSPIRPETYLDFVVAEDRPVAERIVRGLITSRTGFEETLRIEVGDVVKTVRVKAAGAFDAAGVPLRMLGVDLDISEVQRLEADNLHLRLTQQQALFRAVLEAQETERHRMAESLHNGLGQTLYATKLQLNQLLAGPAPAALNRADQLLADAIRQTRTLSHELVPTALNEFGLTAALRDICRSLRSPHLRFEYTVELDTQQPLPQPLQVAVYRMAQELAQNVVKHARATEASLALETVPGFVLLRVEDNGVGFATPQVPGTGIGLRTIRDRVALLGGTVDLGSSPEFGTYVRIRFPLPTSTTPSA